MEKSTKNCRQSWIFQKSPAHKIMICMIALQMQWQAKANLWWQVTNTKNWHFKSAVSKREQGKYYTTRSNYSPKLLMFPYLKNTSRETETSSPIQPDPLSRRSGPLYGFWHKSARGPKPCRGIGDFGNLQTFPEVYIYNIHVVFFCRVLAKEHACFFKNEMNKLFIGYIYIRILTVIILYLRSTAPRHCVADVQTHGSEPKLHRIIVAHLVFQKEGRLRCFNNITGYIMIMISITYPTG